jgi:hypothetical protein
MNESGRLTILSYVRVAIRIEGGPTPHRSERIERPE